MTSSPQADRPSSPPPSSTEIDASMYLHPRTLARLGSFELRAKQIVEGVMSGQHRSPYKGFSVDFAQHRPYVSGDDIRHLDWKVYARSDKLHLKQYQQETNVDLIVMVDCSGSMNFGSRLFAEASGSAQKTSIDGRDNWTKFDHATAVAAALSYITLSQGDRVGMVTFADETLSFVGRSSSRGTWRQIVRALAVHPVDKPTDLRRAIDQTLAKVTNRCIIALISDMFEDLDTLRQAMARIRHRGHDLVVFQVLDQSELTFDFADPAPFQGLEGEPMLRIDPRAIKQSYLDAINAHNKAVQKLARSFGFDYQLVNTHEWLGPTLASFIAHRNAMIKRSKLS